MNMQALMQQAQKMQKDLQKKKGELDSLEFVGKSELVEVTFKGNKTLSKVKILGEVDSDDKEVLEDMFVIAVNDAMKQIDDKTNDMMGAYGGQLGGLF